MQLLAVHILFPFFFIFYYQALLPPPKGGRRWLQFHHGINRRNVPSSSLVCPFGVLSSGSERRSSAEALLDQPDRGPRQGRRAGQPRLHHASKQLKLPPVSVGRRDDQSKVIKIIRQ